MPREHWTGASLPASGDSLLQAWEDAFDTAGVVVSAVSVPAAREKLRQVVASGVGVSSRRPAYFDVSGVIYRADGSLSPDGQLVLRPVNEAECFVRSFSQGFTSEHLTHGAERVLVKVPLPISPHARAVMAMGTAYGAGGSGVIHLSLRLNVADAGRALARFDNGDNTSTSVTNAAVVPAGVAAEVTLSLYGGAPSGGRIQVLSDPTLNRLVVMAFPVTA